MGCKRVLLSNDYYPALQRPNVELVTDRIREVSPAGVVTEDGRERPLDALVLAATGFQAAEAVAPFVIRGRDGKDLDDAWRAGAEAYLGTTITGFPNLFMVVGPNTGLGHNSMIFMIESPGDLHPELASRPCALGACASSTCAPRRRPGTTTGSRRGWPRRCGPPAGARAGT